VRRPARARAADPACVRVGRVAVLALTGVLVLWGLSRSGSSNTCLAGRERDLSAPKLAGR
jgi:hypothetical protein